jgi:glycosyltransferase involved in cell wall biosynthesis
VIFGINALSVRPDPARGSETYLRELVAHLALVDAENEYCLFVSPANRACFRTDSPNVRAIECPGIRRGEFHWPAIEQLWLPLAARQAAIDVLLCPRSSVPRLWSRPAVITVPDLLTFHPEFWTHAGGPLRRWQSRLRDRGHRARLRASARRASAVLAVSEQTRRETARHCAVDPTRIVVARHGVSGEFQPIQDRERVAALLEQHGLRAPFLLVVGTISPYKNLNRVMEGLAQVRRWSHRLPMLALVGEERFDCRAGLERLAVSLDLQEHVRFLGVLPQATLPTLYTAAVASLSLSSCESFGLPIVESMACGCPVICARRSSLPEVAGEAALFVDPDRPQEVAEAIWRLSTLPNVREAWVEAGIERARQFDWRETARITRDVLVAVAEGRPPREAAGARRQTPVEIADGAGPRRE